MINPKLFFLFLIFSLRLQSQGLTPASPLPHSNINILYLENLVKIGIDSVRVENGLKPLRNDSVLFVAADDHAGYLNKNNLLSHFENDNPQKYAPSDRVKFHGGDDFSGVGENVLTNFAFTPLKNKYDGPNDPPHVNNTYGELASDMVSCWVHSPPHYKNILTSQYEFTGVAIAWNPQDNSFKAVQVFGIRPFYKNGKEDSLVFPYSTYVPPPVTSSFDQVSHEPHSKVHAYGLRAPDDSTKVCPDCWNENFTPGTTRIEVKNGKAIFYTEDTELMKRILNNRKDGLALEIVRYKPFDCGNPEYYEKASRRNGQCIFSGIVLKPIYRKKLKKGFKKRDHLNFHEKMRSVKFLMKEMGSLTSKARAVHDVFYYPFVSEFFTVSLGRIPKGMIDGYYEVNVVVIQKKQVCRVLHFSSFCGNDWNVEQPVADVVRFSDDSFQLKSKERNYNFNIPFEQAKVDYKYTDIKPFLDSIGTSSFTILNVSIEAFASVEGSEVVNNRLTNQRASSIVNAMQGVQKDSINKLISCSENWKMFDAQLKSVPQFSIFKGKTHAEIKSMLNDTALANKLEPWLAKERTAHVLLKVRVDYSPQNSCDWLIPRFTMYADSVQNGVRKNLVPNYLDSLADLQAWYYQQLVKKQGDTTCLSKIEYSSKSPFDTLAYNWSWMKRYCLNVTDTAQSDLRFYSNCVNIMNGNAVNPYWPAVYTFAKYDVKYWTPDRSLSGDPEKTWNWLSWLKTVAPDSMQERITLLQLDWHYKAVNYYSAKGKAYKTKVIRSLAGIALYWQDSSRINDSIALVLCNYLLLHEQVNWAYLVLQPYALKSNPRHDVLMQYLRMTYRHKEEAPDFVDYYRMIAWAKTYLTPEEWCSLFVGPCNISFQLWDSEGMRNMYCEQCADYKNYAKDPSKWKKSAK